MSASRQSGQPACAQAKLATPQEWQTVKIAMATSPFRVRILAIPIILLEDVAILSQMRVKFELTPSIF
jgi:hypothetical protein